MTRVCAPWSPLARARRRLLQGWKALEQGSLDNARFCATEILSCDFDPYTRRRFDFSLVVVDAHLLLGRASRLDVDLPVAIEAHRQALLINERHAPESPHVAARAVAIHCGLGDALRMLGDYDTSEFHHTIAEQFAHDASDPSLLAIALNAHGVLLKDTDQLPAAEQRYASALATGEHCWGTTSPRLADVLHNLAGLAHRQGEWKAGESSIRRAIRLRERSRPQRPTALAGDLCVLGALLLGGGQVSEGRQILDRSLALWLSVVGASHYEIAVVRYNLAEACFWEGDHRGALDQLRRALVIKREVLGPAHHEVHALKLSIAELGSSGRDAQ